jgi:RecA/RadA recombinase
MKVDEVENLKRVDLDPVQDWLSTGCTLLDLAIADRLPGGFPAGRISHIIGQESTAKTVLLTEILGSAQCQKGKAYFADAEHTFDFSRAELFGVDVNASYAWQYFTPSSIEELFDEYIQGAIDE